MDERDMRYRDMRGMDGRRLPPRNSRGEFRRRRRSDRGMDYGDMRNDMRMRDYDMDMRRGDGRVIRSYPNIYPQGDYGDMNYDMARGGRGGRRDYGEDMRRGDYEMDGHHMGGGRESGYEPVEFMGYCSGYYGSPDHGRGRGRDYGDYRGGYGRRDYGDYGYDYGYPYGDFGETLSEQELEKWNKKLLEQLDEREKQMFHKDAIIQKAKQMGKPMEGFGEKELYTATLMVYADYKQSIGQNVDLSVKLAYDWLSDKDVAVKGAEKLAVYYDCIVEGE